MDINKTKQINLKSLLKDAVVKTSKGRTKEEIAKENETIECDTFNSYYNSNKEKDKDGTYKAIPRFYFKLPKEDEVLAQKFREESRAMFLQRRSRELLDNNELKALWALLDKHHSPPHYADEQLINYHDFMKVASLTGKLK